MKNEHSQSIAAKLVAGTWWNIAWRALSRGFGFISLLVLAQLLLPKDIGVVAIAASLNGVMDSLSQLGVREALIRLKDRSEDYYDTAFTIQVGRGLFTAALLVGLSIFSNKWVGDTRVSGVLLALAGSAVIGGFENIGYVRVQRELDFKLQFALQVAPRTLAFGCTIFIAYFFRTYWAIVAGGILARTSGVIITYLVYPHIPRLSLFGWQYLLKFSLWAWVGSLAVSLWTRTDPFVIGPFVGATALGIYMLSLEIGMLPITELLEPAASTLFPGFALARHEGGSPSKMGLEVATVLAFGTIPFALGLSATSGYVVTAVLGHKWDACQPVIAVVTWVAVFAPFSYVSATALSVEGNVKRVAISNVVAAAIKIVALVLVRESRDLTLISWTAVAVVAAESTIFVAQLRAVSGGGIGLFLGSVARCFVSLAACVGVLRLVPGTWSLVDMNRSSAFLLGGAIGVSTFLLFGSVLFGLWAACGSPASAEKRALELLKRHVSQVLKWKIRAA